MARYSVRSGDAELVVESTPDGRVSITIEPPGPFTADPDTMERARILIGATIGIAHFVPTVHAGHPLSHVAEPNGRGTPQMGAG